VVFVLNIVCAIQFVVWPDQYAPSFEVDGVPGRAMVQGIGVLFLMWNATYPLVIWDPLRHRALFGVVLAQQLIGVAGETMIFASVPAAHVALRASGSRFITFDTGGLGLMVVAFGILLACERRTHGHGRQGAPKRGR
jgi:hypothetical protein